LQSLLQLLLALLQTRLALGAQLLQPLLLLGGQKGVDLALEPGVLDRKLRLGPGQLLHRGANPPFIDWQGLGRPAPRLLRPPHLINQRARLLPMLLGELTDLFLLRLSQVELAKRQVGSRPGAGTRPTAAEPAEGGALCVRREARQDDGHESGDRGDMKTTNHTWYLQLNTVFTI
jgi:hypothetical protein